MEITSVTIPTDDLAEAEGFYGRVLELPVRREDGLGLVVSVGRTELRLAEQRPSDGAVDHLAVTVPADGLDGAKRWLQERVELLALDGRDEFEGAPSWDSRSVYFPGPSRSVLELIARRRLSTSTGGAPFGPQHLLGISEVGVAVSDVPTAVRQLQGEAGLEVFGDGVGETFAAVGDDDGLLVVVAEGRPWFPTADRRVTATPRRVTVTSPVAGPEPTCVELGGTRLELSRQGDWSRRPQ